MRQSALGLVLLSLSITACGDSASAPTPLEELVQDAAKGDADAMEDLEQQVAAKAAEVKEELDTKASDGDEEAAVMKAMMAGGDAAVLKLAEAGNVWAMFAYGKAKNALSSAADRTEGRDWILRAAKEGHEGALFIAGKHSYNGLTGFETNLEDGRAWLEQAANAGNGEAAYALATYSRYGIGTETDEALAIEWLKKADAAGFAAAARDLKDLGAE